MVGFQGESQADRRALEGAASRSFRDVQAMFKRVRAPEEEKREGAPLARRFKQSVFFGHPQRRLVQSERRYGAEPRLHGCSCKAFSCDAKNNF